MTAREILLSLAIKHNGDWDKIYKCIKNKEEVEELSYNGDYITIVDENYPKELKNINKPPFVLFYKGNLDLLKQSKIAIVGTKENEDFVEEVMKRVGGETIINDGSKGVCEKAIKLAGKNSIVVLNHGLRETQAGLTICEYPFTQTQTGNNHERIVVGLCEKVIVCKIENYSKEMLVVSFALEFGKEVAVIPTEPFGGKWYNNALISEGAEIIY